MIPGISDLEVSLLELLEGWIPEFQFGMKELIDLWWSIPLVLLLCAWGVARRTRILAAFGIDAARHGEWISGCSRRRWLRATVLSFALLFLTAAALQPRSHPEKTRFRRTVRDIAVVVDVSRSMLAEDLKPNRLERAKLELSRLCDHLEESRVGLVAFAGNAVIQCPLTSNYSYFKSILKNLTPRSASQGGTRIGDAVRKTLDNLLGVRRRPGQALPEDVQPGETQTEAEARREERPPSYSDILLITDGEDHDSHPLHAAERAAMADVGLYIVGLGSDAPEGTPIPVRTENGENVEFLRYKGEIVRSRLDSKTLMEMINKAPRGSFLPAGTDHFDLVGFYEKAMADREGREIQEESLSWTEIFQPFLLFGIVIYMLYLAVSERPGRQRSIELPEATP